MKSLTQALLAVATAGLAIQSAHGAGAPADFDGDGKSDIFWRNAATGENYAYCMAGTSIVREGYVRTVSNLDWQVAGVGDFNGDGKSDILWRNARNGQNYLYPMNGTTILATEGFIRTVADPKWQVKATADFNGDGRADVLWRNSTTGENYVYLMQGTTISAEGYLRTVGLEWQAVGAGDFNGDGKADILWRNKATGENYIYFMSGTSIASEGYLRTVASQSWRVAGVGDFNGDLRDDILWRNMSTGENYVYLMNGLNVAGEGYVRTVSSPAWRLVATGDYDGDGKADILWRHASTGENYLYPMAGTTIKPTEGYIRNVASSTWQLAPAATTATLVWDTVVAPNLSGYRVYYGTAPGTYLQSPGQGLSVGNATVYTATMLSSGTRYHFAVTAVDSSGNESPYSNEVFKDVQ
jgi:hypothetical protein